MTEQERIEIEKLARALCKFWRVRQEDIEDYIQEAYLVALEHEEKRDELIKKALAKKRGKEKTRRNKEILSKNLFLCGYLNNNNDTPLRRRRFCFLIFLCGYLNNNNDTARNTR